MVNEVLGSRIKTLRKSKGLTQEQLADAIGISRQKYMRIEGGVNNITLDLLVKISDELDVTVEDITRVLDEEPVVEHRLGDKNGSSMKMFDMLDLFYANKHLYEKYNVQNEDF